MTTNRTDERECGQGELLVAVLYGEANDAELERFDAHRRACSACAEEYAAFERIRGELGAWEVDVIPHVRVEIRPGFVERLRNGFAGMSFGARLATVAACAVVVLALVNAEVAVGSAGVSVRFHLLPQPASSSAAAAPNARSEDEMRRVVAEQVDATVRAELAAYRQEMEAQLGELETRLTTATSDDDVRRLTVQVSAQRRRIEQLQRDVDRTAGYGGSDLFGAVLSPREPGS